MGGVLRPLARRGTIPIVAGPARWKQAIPWSIVAVSAVITAVMYWSDSPVIPNVQPVTRTEITLPSTSPLGFGATFAYDPTLIAMSPDGKQLVFVGSRMDELSRMP